LHRSHQPTHTADTGRLRPDPLSTSPGSGVAPAAHLFRRGFTETRHRNILSHFTLLPYLHDRILETSSRNGRNDSCVLSSKPIRGYKMFIRSNIRRFTQSSLYGLLIRESISLSSPSGPCPGSLPPPKFCETSNQKFIIRAQRRKKNTYLTETCTSS
jgi:hypothetical protein